MEGEGASLAAWAGQLVALEADRARRRPYRTYRDTWLAIASVTAQRRVAASSWGVSRGGQPIWAVDVAPSRARARAVTVVVAGLHAMEHVGVATAVALLNAPHLVHPARSADRPRHRQRPSGHRVPGRSMR